MACAHIWITKKCRQSSVFSFHNLISWLLRKWRSYGLTFFLCQLSQFTLPCSFTSAFLKGSASMSFTYLRKIEYCPMHRPCLQFHRRAVIHKMPSLGSLRVKSWILLETELFSAINRVSLSSFHLISMTEILLKEQDNCKLYCSNDAWSFTESFHMHTRPRCHKRFIVDTMPLVAMESIRSTVRLPLIQYLKCQWRSTSHAMSEIHWRYSPQIISQFYWRLALCIPYLRQCWWFVFLFVKFSLKGHYPYHAWSFPGI